MLSRRGAAQHPASVPVAPVGYFHKNVYFIEKNSRDLTLYPTKNRINKLSDIFQKAS